MTVGTEPKKVFVAATMQDQGKTTVSLGLMAAFHDLAPPVGFIKPVGQRYVEIQGVRVDEDVALMRAIFPAEGDLADMSPVTVGRSFTRDYIRDPKPDVLMERIRRSFDRVSAGKRVMVVEGTGHAGVGSCFDTSNADVAKLLNAKAVLITAGGIGRPIDEVMLNRSLFRERGVELLGVILNKVLPEKMEEIREIVGLGLGRLGTRLLGCIPREPALERPSMRQILEEIGGRLLHGEAWLDNNVDGVIVGAMTAHHALGYITPQCLLITPGDRDDLILAALSTSALGADADRSVSGILLTGGVQPHRNIVGLLERTRIPVILHEEDSYSVAAAVNGMKVKIQPTDSEKIAAVPRLVRQYVDVPGILESL